MLELDFGDTPEKLKGEYLDMYKGIQSEILSTTRFDEHSDISTTYLGNPCEDFSFCCTTFDSIDFSL